MKQNTQHSTEFLLDVIQSFIRITASADSNLEIFEAITKNFMQKLNVEECVVYEFEKKSKTLLQRAIHGKKSPNGEMDNFIRSLKLNEGIVGWVAENQLSVMIGDTNKDSRYIVDRGNNLSELAVPIIFNGELLGVIDSENSQLNYFTNYDLQLFEMIAELAAGLLIRIRQKNELINLKSELELILRTKKIALEKAIDTVSDQVSELRHQKIKKEILIREVHHRVNNNLQILSSLINIYLSDSGKIDRSTLNEIKNKIQVLSSIHLILLKSVEKDRPSISDFLNDLIASIRYMNQANYLVLSAESKGHIFSLNTLIPLGLLLNELINVSSKIYWNKGELVLLHMILVADSDEFFTIEILSDKKVIKKNQIENHAIDEILIEAFIDQLNGEILPSSNELTLWKVKLEEID